jgi:hypothetical protein
MRSALAAVTLTLITSAVNAAPVNGVAKSLDLASPATTLVQDVQYRGRNYVRRSNRQSDYRHRNNSGRNLARGIGGLIIGGIALSQAARAEHRRDHRSAWQRCAQTYRSFETSTGMYTGYDGKRYVCPYLR